jgi:hypothetical protein
MKNVLIIVLIIWGYSSIAQNSQNVAITLPVIALMDIVPKTTAFTLSLTAPTEAGNTVTNTATNSSRWINFTSAVAPNVTRKIAAQISGTVPNGITIRLVTSNFTGVNGGGAVGSSTGTITLSNTSQTIINNIGGGFTGNGTSRGYNLTYSLQINDYSLLKAQSNTLTIIYTMSDN